MCNDNPTPYNFSYADSSGNLHGPFPYGPFRDCYVSAASILYHSRKLRKHHQLDFGNNSSLNHKLHHIETNGNAAEFIIRKPLDSYWALKTVRYYNKNVQQWPIYPYVLYWIICLLNCSIFILQIISSFACIPQTSYIHQIIIALAMILLIIAVQYFTIFLTIFIWKLFIFYMNNKNITQLIKSRFISRYHQKLSDWNAKFNNLSFYQFLKLLFNTPNFLCRVCKIMYRIFFCLFPNTMISMILLTNYPDDVLKWVLPDYYDIQQDIQFFVIDKLENIIDQKSELMTCIYHIVNAVVAKEIASTRYPSESYKNIIAVNVSYLYCLEQYSRNQFCVSHDYDQQMNSKHCLGCHNHHIFDYKYICFEDWKHYQWINGYKYENQFISYLFRNAHKYMFPFFPFIFLMNISEFIAVYIISPYGISIVTWWVFICIIIILMIWSIYDFYLYQSQFSNITKNIKFWMSPYLLGFLSRHTSYSKDSFIVSSILHIISTIEIFLKQLHQNNIYCKSVMQADYILPYLVVQIILEYVCTYQRINCLSGYNMASYNVRELHRSMYYYNVDELHNKMNAMIENVKGLNIDGLIHRSSDDNMQCVVHGDYIAVFDNYSYE